MSNVIRKINILLDKKQKIQVLLLGILMLIGGVFETLGVSMIVPLGSAVLDSEKMAKNPIVIDVCDTLKIESMTGFLVLLLSLLIFIYIVKNAFLLFQCYMQYRFVCNNKYIVQTKLFHAFLKKPYEYYLNASTGEITRVIGKDVSGAFDLITAFLNLCTEFVVAAFLVVAIIVMNPLVAIIIGFCMLGTTILITRIVKPVLKNAANNYVESTKQANKWLFQAINGIKEVKVEKKETFFLHKFAFYGKKSFQSEQINSTLNSMPRMLIETAGICCMLGSMIVLIVSGHNTAELWTQIMAFVVAAIRLLPSVNRINSAITAINYNEPMLDKVLDNLESLDIHDLFDVDKKFVELQENFTLPFDDSVMLKNITYKYPGAKGYVFENADMVIPKGKTIGIIGTSGAGKTTIVDVLLGLLQIQGGNVFVDGIDIKDNYSGWLAHISYIPQMIFMLDDTIRANVAFGKDEESICDDDVWRALEEAQLAEYVRSLPDGLDTTIGERGIRISGGQRQRIGIARALYTKADVLVFDEATSALDNETEQAIVSSINALKGKRTMVIIAHRLAATKNCDIMYKVQDGKILLVEDHT